jgi:UDP-N-acetylglucosamine 2-epimerase (non-hydrolysing)
MKKRVITVTGIRPDFIRMSEVFKKLDNKFDHILVHTGQHYDPNLSDVFFRDLEIRAPNYNLSIGAPGKAHYEQVADLSVKLTRLCLELKPDLVIFLGDSNSVLASIPLHKEGFKVAHIEAGMRSYYRSMLEETNRVACDHVSDLLFVYHDNYKFKLINENVDRRTIHVVGNTIVEPLLKIADLNYRPEPKHILLDIHRPENFKFKKRMEGIISSAKAFGDYFNLPIKMLDFSRTSSSIANFDMDMSGVDVIPLMGYRDFIRFQQESLFVYSDSGSAQEESCLLKRPVLVPRDHTERPESNEANCSRMIGLTTGDLGAQVSDAILWIESHFPEFQGKTEWLGAGTTSQKIVDIIESKI